MTSALMSTMSQAGQANDRPGHGHTGRSIFHTRDRQGFVYNKAIDAISKGMTQLENQEQHTPANTLVISRTLIPANGKVAASAAPTGVASHLLC